MKLETTRRVSVRATLNEICEKGPADCFTNQILIAAQVILFCDNAKRFDVNVDHLQSAYDEALTILRMKLEEWKTFGSRTPVSDAIRNLIEVIVTSHPVK